MMISGNNDGNHENGIKIINFQVKNPKSMSKSKSI